LATGKIADAEEMLRLAKDSYDTAGKIDPTQATEANRALAQL